MDGPGEERPAHQDQRQQAPNPEPVLPRQQYERDQSACLRRARCFLFHRLTILIGITVNLEEPLYGGFRPVAFTCRRVYYGVGLQWKRPRFQTPGLHAPQEQHHDQERLANQG